MRTMILAVALTVVTGCAVQKPMTPGVAGSLKGKQGVTVPGRQPGFTAMTAGKAMFGAIGAAAMIAEGNEIVRRTGIEDPALKLGADLAQALSRGLGATVAAPSAPINRVDPATIGQFFPKADFVLEVQTVDWSFVYFPSDWSRYRVIYVARARLIDPKTKQVLAEGTARHVPEKTPDAPTYDELLASNGARLKAELNKSAAKCYEQLLRDTFKL